MFWGQASIEFRRKNNARSWPNFRAWHLRTDSKSAFATSLVGSRSPPLTTSFGISAFDMSRGTHPPTLPMSSRMHHFPNRRPPDHRTAHTYQRGYGRPLGEWSQPALAGRAPVALTPFMLRNSLRTTNRLGFSAKLATASSAGLPAKHNLLSILEKSAILPRANTEGPQPRGSP